MRKTGWIMLLLSGFFAGAAQDLKVSVISSEGEPMGYAYVYVNDKIYESADSSGVVFIPRDYLQPGDSVATSFVGAGRAASLYDPQNDELVLELPASVMMEKIVVLYDNSSRELFRKYVKSRTNALPNDLFTSDFDVTSEGGFSVAGKFYALNTSSSYEEETGRSAFWIESGADTAGYGSEVVSLLTTLFRAGMTAGAPGFKVWKNPEAVIKYMGQEAGAHLFFLTYLWKRTRTDRYHTAVETFQTMLYVDERSGEVLAAVGDAFFADGTRIEYQAAYKALPANKINHVKKIRGAVVRPDGARWSVRIDGAERGRYHPKKEGRQ